MITICLEQPKSMKSGKNSMTSPKIQRLYTTVETLCTVIHLRKGGGVWGHHFLLTHFHHSTE